MRLKSLELIGFKSFVDRTVITFETGITSIVGPNGSGKSNCVDAIRWVMGEQSAKHLRGSDMSDIIFNGSEARPATGMASVFLTFDNSDGRAPAEYASYSEITVGRRLYRSGESEYYINKVPCRLKDIVEFFLGTGVGSKAYSIVEQGQVERIVSAKPEERRQLLEEAAGISKFKMHRDSALRKIEATRQNLARLADIITELEHQKNSLSRQAKKAERYKTHSDELKELELGTASHQYCIWHDELTELQNKISALLQDEAGRGAQVSNEETQIDSKRLETSETERKLNTLQEKVYELQNQMRLNEAEAKFKTDQLSAMRTRCEDDGREIVNLKSRMTALESELSSLNAMKVNIDVELAQFEEAMTVVQKRADDVKNEYDGTDQKIEDLRRDIVELIRTASEARARADQIDRQDIDLAGKIVKNQTEIDAIDKKIVEIETGMSEGKTRLDTMCGTKEGVTVEISSLTSDTDKLRTELLHNETELAELTQRFSVKKSRLTSLEELSASFEGYHDGVRAVLKRRAENPALNGIFGTVSEMIETDPSYETAVGAALGEKLQYVVVKSHQEGVEAIDYLKTQTAGRSTFVPMEVRSVDSEPAPNGEGVIGPLIDYVRFSNEYTKIGKYLLNDVVLVEDLQKALNIWQTNGHKKTLVTLSGEVVDHHGAVSGGTGGDTSSRFLAKKREMAELSIEVSRLTSEVGTRGRVLNDIRSQVQINDARIAQLKTALHTHEVEFIHKERDLLGMSQDLENWRRSRDKLSIETAALAEERKTNTSEKEVLVLKINSEEDCHKKFEVELNCLLNTSETLKANLLQISEEVTAKKVQFASVQEQSLGTDREIKRVADSITEINCGISAKMTDITETNAQIESDMRALELAKSEVGRLVQEIEAVTKEQTELKASYDKTLEDLRNKELSLRELRKAYEETKNAAHELKLTEAKTSEKIFYLEREIQEKYHIDLASRYNELQIEIKDEEHFNGLVQKVAELKEKIEKIGSVSTDAITEYEGVVERYNFLTRQSEDLKTSLETLQKAIVRINRTSKERFVETFNAVNEKFKTLFPRLFHGGGKAELLLLDQENVLESGIEIIAQPPGKKLQSVGLLSGGEKALVATTFIFSIFLIKPSPFCLLDEVDAPLDDANIDRFNQLVREMSKLSQFIMITHNRRTMELADTLYGVTMEEAGISKIVSVRLEQNTAEQKAA